MAIRYLPIDGKVVSYKHLPWMLAARHDGVVFRVNSGHRTITQQWYLYNHQPPLAAYPSDNAPHIKTGRANHDNDIDMYYGDGIQGLFRWLRKHGAHPVLNVPGEGWHMHITDADLNMLYAKYKHTTLHVGSTGEAVQTAQVMMRTIGRWPHKVGKTFGQRFKAAVRGYQRSQGIKDDGVIGPTTLKHLRADYERKKGN